MIRRAHSLVLMVVPAVMAAFPTMEKRHEFPADPQHPLLLRAISGRERKACKAWVRAINQFKSGSLRSGTGSLLGSDPLAECIAEARRHLAETARILKHEYPSFPV